MEVRSPSDAQAKVTALAEREGGWVASAARETAELLERDVAMSTIRVTLNAPPADSVAASKFGRSISDAVSDAVLIAVVAIRLTGILVPIAVMLGFPLLFAVLYFKRRANRARRELLAPNPADSAAL